MGGVVQAFFSTDGTLRKQRLYITWKAKKEIHFLCEKKRIVKERIRWAGVLSAQKRVKTKIHIRFF